MAGEIAAGASVLQGVVGYKGNRQAARYAQQVAERDAEVARNEAVLLARAKRDEIQERFAQIAPVPELPHHGGSVTFRKLAAALGEYDRHVGKLRLLPSECAVEENMTRRA